MASGVRTMEMANSLRKKGVEPIVLSPYVHTQMTKEKIRIVQVPTLLSPLKIENQVYGFSRRIYYSRSLQKLVIKISKRLAKGQVQISPKLFEVLKALDLDIIQGEQDNAGLLLLSAQSKLDLPVVLDLHGIWPEELLSAGAIKMDSADWKDLQGLMRHLINGVDLTISLSEAMREYVLTNYDVDSRRVRVVPPGGKAFLVKYAERPQPSRVVYAGTVTYRKHVDLFIRSIAHIQGRMPNVEFCVTRKGDLLSSIQGLASKLKVNPKYLWFPDLQETLKFLSKSHIGVLPSTNDTSARISMPSKLFDYLSAGLPVVANDVGGWVNIIRKHNLGRVTSDEPKAFAKGIMELLNAPDELADCGARGIKLIKDTYNWDSSASMLIESYKKLI
jgi:glycosyltransferase involved in cell wall biosynthesis